MNIDLSPFSELVTELKGLLKVDSVRIVLIGNSYWLIIGQYQTTLANQDYYWTLSTELNSARIDFDYLSEKVICSGETLDELRLNAIEYQRINQLSIKEYLKELGVTINE